MRKIFSGIIAGLAAMCGGAAMAATPVASWKGNFPTDSDNTTIGDISMVMNTSYNTRTADKIVIGSTKGIWLTKNTACAAWPAMPMTVVAAVKNAKDDAPIIVLGTANGFSRFGVMPVSETGKIQALYASGKWSDPRGVSTIDYSHESALVAFGYDTAGGVCGYNGSYYAFDGLAESKKGNVTRAAIGSLRADSSANPSTGLEVSAVWVFKSKLSEADMKLWTTAPVAALEANKHVELAGDAALDDDLTVLSVEATKALTLTPTKGATLTVLGGFFANNKVTIDCTNITGHQTIIDGAVYGLDNIETTNLAEGLVLYKENDCVVISGTPVDYFAEITDNVTWSTKAGLSNANPSTYSDSPTSTITLNDYSTEGEHTVEFDDAVIAASLAVAGSGNVKLTKDESVGVDIAAYDFSASTGKTTIDYDTGTATITAGTDTVLNGTGTGKITMATNQTVTVGYDHFEDDINVSDGSKVVGPASSTLVFDMGADGEQSISGSNQSGTADRVFGLTVKSGTLSVTGGNSGTSLFTGRTVTADGETAVIKTVAKDATGWNGGCTKIVVQNGGTFAFGKRDTLKAPIDFCGGTVKLLSGCADGGRALDLYGNNNWTVTAAEGATADDPTVSYLTYENGASDNDKAALLRSEALNISVADNAELDVNVPIVKDTYNAGGTAGKVIKTGNGKLVLAGANTYTTETEIQGGTVDMLGNNTIGAISTTGDAATVNILGGGTYGAISTAGATTLNMMGVCSCGEIHSTGTNTTLSVGDSTHNSTVTATRLELGDCISGSGTLTVAEGSTLKVTSETDTFTAGYQYKSEGVIFGEWEAPLAATINGTFLSVGATVQPGDKGYTMTIGENGVVAVKGIGTKGEKAYKDQPVTLTVNGGQLILGANGIVDSTKTVTTTLAGGTVGTYADSMPIAKAITVNAATTFDTTKYTVDTDANTVTRGTEAATVTVSGAIDGSGAMTVDGAGTLALTGTMSDYKGTITLNSGTLSVAKTSGLTKSGIAPAVGFALNDYATESVDIYTLTAMDDVKVTVPTVANATITVTANGTPVTGENGVYMVKYGSTVVVTYTGATSYVPETTSVNYDRVTEDTEVEAWEQPTMTRQIYVTKFDGDNSTYVLSDGTTTSFAAGDIVVLDEDNYESGNARWNVTIPATMSTATKLVDDYQYDGNPGFTCTGIPAGTTVEIKSGTRLYFRADGNDIGDGVKIFGEGSLYLNIENGKAVDIVGDVEIICPIEYTVTKDQIRLATDSATLKVLTSANLTDELVVPSVMEKKVVKATEGDYTIYSLEDDPNGPDGIGLWPYHWYPFNGICNTRGQNPVGWNITPNAQGISGEANTAITGNNSYGSSGLSFGSGDWTMVIVGKLSTTANGVMFAAGSTESGSSAFAIASQGGTNPGVKIISNGTLSLAADVADATTAFHEYALTKVGTTYTLYVDGAKMADQTCDFAVTQGNWQFGSTYNGGLGAWDTSYVIDDFRVYHQALTQPQLRTIAKTFGLTVTVGFAVVPAEHTEVTAVKMNGTEVDPTTSTILADYSYEVTFTITDTEYEFEGGLTTTNITGTASVEDVVVNGPVPTKIATTGWDKAATASDTDKASDVWTSIPNNLADANAKELAKWAKDNNVDFANAGTINVNAFLLNLAPTASVDKVPVTAITIDADGNIVIDTGDIDLTQANGVVYVYTGNDVTDLTARALTDDELATKKVNIEKVEGHTAGFYKIGVGFSVPTEPAAEK